MMQVKRYIAATFAEALIQAKNELGTDAVIVESKKVRVGGFLGFFGREMTELTVAVDTKPNPKPMPRPMQPPPAPTPAPAPTQDSTPQVVVPLATTAPPVNTAAITNLEREMAGLRSALTQLLEKGAEAPELTGFAKSAHDRLVDRGVEEAAALAIAKGLPAEAGEQELKDEILRLIGPSAAIDVQKGQRKVVALVGPTGVGKTTTLAKLAAHFTLDRGLDVALITSDTFRIAAIEQLRTYASILGVPLYTADRPEEVGVALMETAHKDLVLCDTSGRSHRDDERMAELRELLAVLRPDETHLVISLNMNPRDAYQLLDYYLPLGVNRLTFTKLDEASAPGLLLNIKLRCQQPVGYLTHGQSVPDDIMAADQADFAKLLVGA